MTPVKVTWRIRSTCQHDDDNAAAADDDDDDNNLCHKDSAGLKHELHKLHLRAHYEGLKIISKVQFSSWTILKPLIAL
jgi:hypothetical protein